MIKFVITSLVTVVLCVCCFAEDSQAFGHRRARRLGYGCAGVQASCSAQAEAGCSAEADYGCSAAAASCAGARGDARWFPGRTVLRGTAAVVRGTARVAAAPVRVVGRATFRPQRHRVCGPGGCH